MTDEGDFYVKQKQIHNSDQEDLQSSSGSSLQTWISWFCCLSGHEFYIEVPEDFIDDEFNLTGLSAIVPYYTQALETILDMECGEFFDEDAEDDDEEEEDINHDNTQLPEDDDFWREDDKTPKRHKAQDPRVVEPYAFMLYGLIHQRYLLTRNGLRLMAERYSSSQFGTCPRYYCDKSPVLPMGRYDEAGRESVQLFCPSCLDIYNPPSSFHRCVDGAHFGTTYCHLLFLTYPELVPSPTREIYQPRIYGFKVNAKSRSGPQNQWLRMRPPEEEEEELQQQPISDLIDLTQELQINANQQD